VSAALARKGEGGQLGQSLLAPSLLAGRRHTCEERSIFAHTSAPNPNTPSYSRSVQNRWVNALKLESNCRNTDPTYAPHDEKLSQAAGDSTSRGLWGD